MMVTSAGKLPSKRIVHVVVRNDPEDVRAVVKAVLGLCEDHGCRSVSFPALGTGESVCTRPAPSSGLKLDECAGQGGLPPAAVADAMVGAVVEFVRRKPKSVGSVKILIFQAAMLLEFHRSMRRWQGQDVEEKGVMAKLRGTDTPTWARWRRRRL